MTADPVAPPTTSPWTARVTLSLAVLAASAFVYVTAEIMPVGALPAIAADLGVSEAVVATLLATYALVAAVSTVPLVHWTASWPRRRTLIVTLMCLTVSQLISAAAPTFAVLALGRVLCALTHGLMWSVIAPIGVRLVPPTHAARATMDVIGVVRCCLRGRRRAARVVRPVLLRLFLGGAARRHGRRDTDRGEPGQQPGDGGGGHTSILPYTPGGYIRRWCGAGQSILDYRDRNP